MRTFQNGIFRWEDSDLPAVLYAENGGPFISHDGFRWKQTPFQPNPWVEFNKGVPKRISVILDPVFREIFGNEPIQDDFRVIGGSYDSTAYRDARDKWEQNLRLWERSGRPDYVSDSELFVANEEYEKWGMGKIKTFYKLTNSDWYVTFTNTDLRIAAMYAITYVGQVIAAWQVEEFINKGLKPVKLHPFNDLAEAMKITHSVG